MARKPSSRRERTTKEIVEHIHDMLHDEAFGLKATAELLRHEHRLHHTTLERMEQIMTTLSDISAQSEALMAKVTETRDAQEALKTYVQGIKDQITQLAADLAAALADDDPAAMQQVSENLTAAAEGIDAVAAGEAALQGTEEDPNA